MARFPRRLSKSRPVPARPFLPHPSWNAPDRPAPSATTLPPEAFWSRLDP